MQFSKIISITGHYLVPLLLIISINSCSKKEDNPVTPPDENPVWTYGSVKTYSITPTPGYIVKDTLSGYEFMFPDGGNGTLSISKIISCPEAPFEGAGYKIEFPGSKIFKVLIKPEPGARVLAMAYGKLECLTNGEYKDSWLGIPPIDTIDGKISFILPHTYQISKVSGIAEKARGTNLFWFSQIKPGMGRIETMINIELQAKTFMNEYLAALPEKLRESTKKKIDDKPLTFVYGQRNYYEGYWKPLGNFKPIYHPTVNYALTGTQIPNASNIAHELGHYLTHMIIGNEAQLTLEGQGSIFDNHGIRDEVGRSYLVEEFAYFTEAFFTGMGGNSDLDKPTSTFSGLKPVDKDFPGVEGFGAHMFAALVRTDPQIKTFYSTNLVETPIIGLTYGQVFEIISLGATNMNALRNNIESYISAENAEKLPVLLGRIGWSYSIKGKAVDNSSKPVEGYSVKSVSKVGNRYYEGGSTTEPTKSDGSFSINGNVFGGLSYLRFIKGNDSCDVPISINWDNLTSDLVDLENIIINPGPSIASIFPEEGKPGDLVTITGTNFGIDKTKGLLTFNGAAIGANEILTWTNTQITLYIPNGITSGDVKVRVNGVSSNAKTFTIIVIPAPAIASVTPDTVNVGEKITITGTNFGTDETKAEVIFLVEFGQPFSVKTFTSFSDTRIEVAVPLNARTSIVAVKVDGKFSNEYPIKICRVPVIDYISPDSKKVKEGVLIFGKNFVTPDGKCEAYFTSSSGLSAGRITYWSEGYIAVEVPDDARTGKVYIKVDGNTSNGVMFTVLP